MYKLDGKFVVSPYYKQAEILCPNPDCEKEIVHDHSTSCEWCEAQILWLCLSTYMSEMGEQLPFCVYERPLPAEVVKKLNAPKGRWSR